MIVAEASGFGVRLRQLRIAAGITQAELASRAGLNAMAIHFIETGKREPSWPSVVKLVRALGVSAAAFDEPAADAEPLPVPPAQPQPISKRK